jgi:NitT/TauT family transport system ATP-binding protein
MTRDELNMELQRIWLRSKKTVVFITHSIPEAVFLSDRVLVMAKNPGRIVAEYVIDLPRPRTLSVRGSPEFATYIAEIHEVFAKLGVLRTE